MRNQIEWNANNRFHWFRVQTLFIIPFLTQDCNDNKKDWIFCFLNPTTRLMKLLSFSFMCIFIVIVFISHAILTKEMRKITEPFFSYLIFGTNIPSWLIRTENTKPIFPYNGTIYVNIMIINENPMILSVSTPAVASTMSLTTSTPLNPFLSFATICCSLLVHVSLSSIHSTFRYQFKLGFSLIQPTYSQLTFSFQYSLSFILFIPILSLIPYCRIIRVIIAEVITVFVATEFSSMDSTPKQNYLLLERWETWERSEGVGPENLAC